MFWTFFFGKKTFRTLEQPNSTPKKFNKRIQTPGPYVQFETAKNKTDNIARKGDSKSLTILTLSKSTAGRLMHAGMLKVYY